MRYRFRAVLHFIVRHELSVITAQHEPDFKTEYTGAKLRMCIRFNLGWVGSAIFFPLGQCCTPLTLDKFMRVRRHPRLYSNRRSVIKQVPLKGQRIPQKHCCSILGRNTHTHTARRLRTASNFSCMRLVLGNGLGPAPLSKTGTRDWRSGGVPPEIQKTRG